MIVYGPSDLDPCAAVAKVPTAEVAVPHRTNPSAEIRVFGTEP